MKWDKRARIRNVSAENWEGNIRKWIIENVQNKQIFIDVGANVGSYAICLAKTFQYVIAIEPHPINVEILRNTMDMNSIGNVHIIEKALWDEDRVVHLHQRYKNDLASDTRTFEKKTETDGKRKETFIKSFAVQAITLDSLFLEPDCIKIDADGAELEILGGMKKTIKRYKPILVIEIHHVFGVENKDVDDIVLPYGYMSTRLWGNREVEIYAYIPINTDFKSGDAIVQNKIEVKI